LGEQVEFTQSSNILLRHWLTGKFLRVKTEKSDGTLTLTDSLGEFLQRSKIDRKTFDYLDENDLDNVKL
jgi:hypothetical protein